MRKRNIYCTLDTETVGGACGDNLIYHIAGLIHDRQGNVIAGFNYIIAENYEMFDNAFYAKKNMSRYDEMIRTGIATMIPTEEMALAMVDNLCNYYGVDYMMAYNTNYDFTRTNARVLIENRQFIDIYLMASETLGQRKKYADFCQKNDFRTGSNNAKMSAEVVYAYLTGNPDYEEEHTALEDAKIEMEIFKACINAHQRFTKNCHQQDNPNKWDLYVKL